MKSYSASTFVSLLTIEPPQSNTNSESLSQSSRDLTELNQPLNSITSNTPENSSQTHEKLITQTRETWSHSCDYLITTLGGLIGLGKTFFFFRYFRARLYRMKFNR